LDIMATTETHAADTWLVDLPPTGRQSAAAIGVTAIVLVGFGALVPFAGKPLAELNAFFPSLDAIVLITDLITAVLLLTQFSFSRSGPLLVLAIGYLFTALIVIPHALTFAGAFSPSGLLGAGIQTGSWLFIFWHLGFAASLLAYAALRRRRGAAQTVRAPTMPVIGASVASVLALVCALTWLATGGADLLPVLIEQQSHLSSFVVYPITFTILVSATALVLLWLRPRSVLDQWLMVVVIVSIAELAFSGLLPSVRFSLGFYAGRILALITSSIVLIVLLAETTRLYVRLARSNALLQRERNNKLMNLEAMAGSIAHEVRQPLTGISASGGAALIYMGKTPPDLENARLAVQDMIEATQSASEIFNNIRVLFGRTALVKDPVDVNGLIVEVMRTLDSDFKARRVAARAVLASELPPVTGHKGQLQEVLLNLVQNAIEAMDAVDEHRELKLETKRDDETVTVTVEDTGPGFSQEKAEGIFDAFVTTKPHGMGLGLAICRMIVERHGGRLSASPARPRGAVFWVSLPVTEMA
jgi:signal transduction histidine kinase